MTFPSPAPQNVPEATAAPSVAEAEKVVEPPNPFNVKARETALTTAGMLIFFLTS